MTYAQDMKKIKYLLKVIGILGENGSEDILKVCEYSLKHEEENIKLCILRYCEKAGLDAKILKQRIRRAAKKGLSNLAAMGVEDYYNETFQYHCSLFEFENVRAEMDYIRGKRTDSGKVNVEKFIEGLLLHNEV